MNKTFKIICPYLLILVGLLFLFFMDMAPVAGVFFLLGIVIVVENIWPEKWGTNKV